MRYIAPNLKTDQVQNLKVHNVYVASLIQYHQTRYVLELNSSTNVANYKTGYLKGITAKNQ